MGRSPNQNEQSHITAEIPGVVIEVGVATGDRVLVGVELLVLESMKMEIPVVADSSGVVAQVRVQESDIVGRGDLLIVLDPEPFADPVS